MARKSTDRIRVERRRREVEWRLDEVRDELSALAREDADLAVADQVLQRFEIQDEDDSPQPATEQ